MYANNDVLEAFRNDMLHLVHPDRWKEVSEVPEKGDLDLDLVMKSDFFFA